MNLQPWFHAGQLMLCAISLLLAGTVTSVWSVEVTQTTFFTHSVEDHGYVDEAGELRGKEHAGRRAFNIELVREMMQGVGHAKAMEEMPFNRGLLLLQSNPGYALFNVNRTEKRENEMKWVGPLQHSVTYLYENADHPTGVKSFEEVKGVGSICVLRGNVHHRYLERLGFENIYLANSYSSCVNMLSLGRVSMTPLSNLSQLVLKPQISGTTVLQKTAVKMMESEGYLAFSKETPDEMIRTWQAALDKLKTSGRYQELLDLYLKAE
jgi:polar amino acid transport system substrate-binding protein